MSVYEALQQSLENRQLLPDTPCEAKWTVRFQSPPPRYGGLLAKRLFPLLQSGFLAHGSYGSASLPAQESAAEWNDLMERNPAYFFYNVLYERLAHATKLLARFLNTAPSNILLVRNTEIGLQSVLRSLPLQQHQGVVCFDLTYGAVRQSLQVECDRKELRLFEVRLHDPITADSILDAFSSFLSSHDHDAHPIALASLEHITSPTGITMPIKQLIGICREYQIKTLVDGAHAIGQVHLDLDGLGADFYVSNLHKWFCSRRGCAFLYVAPPFRQTIKPLLVSWGWHHPINSSFIWQGTDDYSAFLSIPVMLRFFHWFENGAGWIERNHRLAVWSGRLLAKVWNTQTLVADSLLSSMVSVLLPSSKNGKDPLVCFSQVKELHKLEAPTFVYGARAGLAARWVRVSCHIYNDEEDTFRLARAVLQQFGYTRPADVAHWRCLAEYEDLYHRRCRM
ncbi:hypothetical protein HDU91_002239 [Kappamyces sp. JEL0680]|nr:hypothetical protein HDU91_002239 [Kappamyces sp. JEL0680]